MPPGFWGFDCCAPQGICRRVYGALQISDRAYAGKRKGRRGLRDVRGGKGAGLAMEPGCLTWLSKMLIAPKPCICSHVLHAKPCMLRSESAWMHACMNSCMQACSRCRTCRMRATRTRRRCSWHLWSAGACGRGVHLHPAACPRQVQLCIIIVNIQNVHSTPCAAGHGDPLHADACARSAPRLAPGGLPHNAFVFGQPACPARPRIHACAWDCKHGALATLALTLTLHRDRYCTLLDPAIAVYVAEALGARWREQREQAAAAAAKEVLLQQVEEGQAGAAVAAPTAAAEGLQQQQQAPGAALGTSGVAVAQAQEQAGGQRQQQQAAAAKPATAAELPPPLPPGAAGEASNTHPQQPGSGSGGAAGTAAELQQEVGCTAVASAGPHMATGTSAPLPSAGGGAGPDASTTRAASEGCVAAAADAGAAPSASAAPDGDDGPASPSTLLAAAHSHNPTHQSVLALYELIGACLATPPAAATGTGTANPPGGPPAGSGRGGKKGAGRGSNAAAGSGGAGRGRGGRKAAVDDDDDAAFGAPEGSTGGGDGDEGALVLRKPLVRWCGPAGGWGGAGKGGSAPFSCVCLCVRACVCDCACVRVCVRVFGGCSCMCACVQCMPPHACVHARSM